MCLAALNVTSFILVLNRQNQMLRWRFIFSVLNAVLDFALIPGWGAMGAVIATGVSNVLLHLLELLIVRDIVAFFPWTFMLKIVTAAGLAGLAGFSLVVFIKSYVWGLVFGSLIFSTILCLMLLVLKPLDSNDLSVAQNLRPRLASKIRYFTHP